VRKGCLGKCRPNSCTCTMQRDWLDSSIITLSSRISVVKLVKITSSETTFWRLVNVLGRSMDASLLVLFIISSMICRSLESATCDLIAVMMKQKLVIKLHETSIGKEKQTMPLCFTACDLSYSANKLCHVHVCS
jgi:hypothetical protein